MKWLLPLLFLLLASPAGATNWYVAPATATPPGLAGNSGLDAGHPKTLDNVNSLVVEGDVVHMAKGYYSGEGIRPDQGGSADDGKIYYVGTFGVGDTTIVPALYLEQPYVSVSGLTAYALESSTPIGTAYGVWCHAAHDSLDTVYMPDGMPLVTYQGDYLKINNCTFHSDTLARMAFGLPGSTSLSDSALLGLSITNSSFTLRHTESSETGGAMVFGSVNGLTFTGNDISITVAPTGQLGMLKLYTTRNGVWTDNTWQFSSERGMAGCDECNEVYLRDYTRNNRFLRCVWNFTGTHEMQMFLGAPGSHANSCRNNTWYDCDIRATAPLKGPAAWFYDGMHRDSIVYSRIISPYTPAFGFAGSAATDSGVVAHNDFLRLCPDTMGLGYDTYTQVLDISGLNSADVLTFKDNICYSKPHRGVDSLLIKEGSPSPKPSAAWVSDTQVSSGYWDGDYNLWYCTSGRDSTVTIGAAPYYASPDSAGTLCSGYTVECHSLYGDPQWVSGTPAIASALTFDFSLQDDSPAIGYGSGYSDMGSEAYGGVADSFTVTYAAGTGGTITCAECNVDGDGDKYVRVAYDSCATAVPVEATASAHYSFLSWDDGAPAYQRPIDCNVTRDTTYAAYFLIDSVTVQYAAAAHGSISGSVYQRVAYGGDATAVTAVPDTGYHFVRWLADSLATAARTDTTCTADTTFTAYFGIDYYTVTWIAGTGGTIVGYNPQIVPYGSSTVTVSAVASTGYSFSAWDDGYSELGGDWTGTILSDSTITAIFALNTYTLTYTAGTGGTISGTSPQTVSYGHNGTTVTAVPSDGYTFYSWSDSLKVASRRDTVVTADVTVSAIFLSVAQPAGVAGIGLSASSAYLSSRSKTFTISSTGTDSLHVYSITLYNLSTRGALSAVSCTKSASTATIAAGGTLDVTLSLIQLRKPRLNRYRIVVTSDAGTATLNLTYDRCP